MKSILVTSLAALLSSVCLMADLPLKLELVAPAQAIIADKATLEKAGVGARGAEQHIELTYRITNTGKKEITLEHGGDATTNFLEVKGPGADDKPFKGAMTMEMRMGKPITIAAGGSMEFTIKGLKYGKRDFSHWVISKPGEYEVTLIHKTFSGSEKVELKSNAVKFSVIVAGA